MEERELKEEQLLLEEQLKLEDTEEEQCQLEDGMWCPSKLARAGDLR